MGWAGAVGVKGEAELVWLELTSAGTSWVARASVS